MQFKSISLAIVFGAAVGFATHASAQGPSLGDIYVGGTLGATFIAPKGLEVDSDKTGDARVSGGLFAGVHVGALPIGSGWPLALEASYQDIARHRLTYKTSNGGRSELTASGRSASLAVKVDVPITERFALYGKLGVAHNKVEGSTPDGQPGIRIDGSKTSPLTAFGLQYRFDAPVTLRAELTNFGKSSGNSSAGGLSVGAAFRF